MTAGDLITAPWQMEWNGMLFGWPASKLTVNNLTGWLSLPDSNSTLTERAGRWGAYPGPMTFGPRVIEATFELTDYHDLDTLRALRRALSPVENPQEQPLVAWFGTDEPELVFARVAKASIPTDYAFSMGYLTATVSWECSQAVRYGVTEQSVTVKPAAAAASGLHFPLSFPLDFGNSLGGGIFTVINAGSTTAWPVFTVTGMCQGFTIAEVATKRALSFDPAYTLPAGAKLIIDTDNRYASQNGVSRDDKLVKRQWFGLKPATETWLRFTAKTADDNATLTVTWRNASAL